MASRTTCPSCGNLFVEAVGPKNAPILIVFDAPGYDEIRDGRLCVKRVGDILRAELARGGIQMSACRVISMYRHGKSKECEYDHTANMVSELQGHEWVLLTSSESSKLLTGHSIMEITGLQAKSKLFPKVKFFGIPHPGTLLRGDVGEMRLAMEKFVEIRSKKK